MRVFVPSLQKAITGCMVWLAGPTTVRSFSEEWHGFRVVNPLRRSSFAKSGEVWIVKKHVLRSSLSKIRHRQINIGCEPTVVLRITSQQITKTTSIGRVITPKCSSAVGDWNGLQKGMETDMRQ